MIYMVTLGGSIKGANLEVHSIQFVQADKVEDTYDILRERWYGDSLHIDGITPFQFIDGYEIVEEGNSEKIPYLIVYGGYQAGIIDELHTYSVVLASSPIEAKQIAKSQLPQFKTMNHVDEVVDIFSNLGSWFGFKSSNCHFQENKTTHTFIKLIE